VVFLLLVNEKPQSKIKNKRNERLYKKTFFQPQLNEQPAVGWKSTIKNMSTDWCLENLCMVLKYENSTVLL